MQNFLKNLFYLAVGLHFMVACSVLPKAGPVSELASLQYQRVTNAELALQELENVDTLIKLDNRWLARQFENELIARAKLGGTYSFRRIEITFTNQIIILDSIVNIRDENGNTISAALSGDIVLKYKGNGLEWRPHFSQLQISSKDFSFADGKYAEPIPELTQSVLRNLNTDLASAAVKNRSKLIPLDPVPLGKVRVGALLPGFSESTARNTQSLRGVFIIAGSAVLIDSSTTSIALDMAFIPDLSTCPADVTVSRAEFASGINSREPVGIAENVNTAANVRYFYSEIAGAKRPLTIIHYWFANGLPVAVEELAVGPSERWRTWSSKGGVNSEASQWEVLVVEKESGCILASKSINTPESVPLNTTVNASQISRAFRGLKDQFESNMAEFSIINEKPGIALIEVRRPFLRDVLQASLADLTIDAEFDESAPSLMQFSAQLQPFDTADITCEHHSCPPAPVCKTSLAQCKRLKDTRNCSSCQFRNPLNNRCVSEAIDPLCEAARKRQNAKYDEERNACLSLAENSKQECDRLNAQAFRSCQIESGFEDSACESVKTSLGELDQDAPLAVVNARTHFNGRMSASFSNFLIEGDLARLKLDISLQSRLELEGELDFKPVGIGGSLGQCIAAWSVPFISRTTSTPSTSSLLGNFEQNPGMLTTHWSGFGVTFETHPSPLESVFVGNPQLLANCNIDLTVNDVEQAIAGDDAAFLSGQVDLVLQPLPTRIHLAPATIEFENVVYSAQPVLSAQYLRFDINE